MTLFEAEPFGPVQSIEKTCVPRTPGVPVPCPLVFGYGCDVQLKGRKGAPPFTVFMTAQLVTLAELHEIVTAPPGVVTSLD